MLDGPHARVVFSLLQPFFLVYDATFRPGVFLNLAGFQAYVFLGMMFFCPWSCCMPSVNLALHHSNSLCCVLSLQEMERSAVLQDLRLCWMVAQHETATGAVVVETLSLHLSGAQLQVLVPVVPLLVLRKIFARRTCLTVTVAHPQSLPDHGVIHGVQSLHGAGQGIREGQLVFPGALVMRAALLIPPKTSKFLLQNRQ